MNLLYLIAHSSIDEKDIILDSHGQQRQRLIRTPSHTPDNLTATVFPTDFERFQAVARLHLPDLKRIIVTRSGGI